MDAQSQPPSPLAPKLKSQWLLDEKIVFLNHGSFGATPRCVFVEQTRWRLKIEAEPIEMLGRRVPELLDVVKQTVGQWLGMRQSDFGFVTNATEGINAVLRSMPLRPEDELVTTNHVYHAVRQAMRYAAGRAGAGYREIEVPLPVESAKQVADRVLNGLSPRTRLLIIDHITSPTALIFPVEQIVAGCAERGVDVMVDGAHAPGMLPLDVSRLGAAYYAGNLHKWACAPKGSGFLWVRSDRQADVHPLVISHHLGEGLAREFSWQGTRDISAWLSIPRAIQFMSDLGWDQVMSHNRAMARWAGRMLVDRWKVEPIAPTDGSMTGSMVTVPLPDSVDASNEAKVRSLQQRLYDEHHIEAPLMHWGGRSFIRPCCQVYNAPVDYERLGDAILRL